MQKRGAQPIAFDGIIDGEPCQKHDRDGVTCQTFRHPAWGVRVCNCTHRQTVIADHALVGNGHIGLRAAGGLVVQGEASEVAIERCVSAVE